MMFFAQSVVGHIFQPSTNLDMIWSPFEMNEFHTAEMRLQKEPFSIGQVSCLAAIRVAEGGGGPRDGLVPQMSPNITQHKQGCAAKSMHAAIFLPHGP